jgi:allantoinase
VFVAVMEIVEMPGSFRAYPRDLVGYGRRLVDPKWPGGARLALQIALNYEAGGESSVLHGDDRSESILTDMGLPAVERARSLAAESSFEYGSRRGVWRALRLFEERDVKVSVFAVVMGLERNPEVAKAMVESGHEIVSHGWWWINYHGVSKRLERDHIHRCVSTLTRLTGTRPVGWFTGRPSLNTRQLLLEEGGFLYDQDAFNDELPYWIEVSGKPHLILPYSLETNDNRFNENSGFNTADDFFTYMKDAFDVLYAEGADEPRMMTLGLHDRLIGRPAKSVGLARFLDHVQKHDSVWICRGADIARHWRENHPPPTDLRVAAGAKRRPSPKRGSG